MVFSSLLFIFFFLPVFLLIYGALPGIYRNSWALLASLLFYTWGAPQFLPILVATSLFDYYLSHRIAPLPDGDISKRRLLALGIAVNLGVLAYCKYSNFFVEQLNGMLDLCQLGPIPWTAVVLPIGISFITFEKISYLVDVSRRVTPPAPSLTAYALFLAFFPHLIAGPIFRYHDIAEQLLTRNHSTELIISGIWRFSLGLAKKVLIADPISGVVESIFSLRYGELSSFLAWFGALAYTMQIYFDFSGYSDMAIGLGRICGFRFVENFNSPYCSRSITEFWRRWHISLSNWMREYLYIPLGGNRVSSRRRLLNLWIVFLLSGLWHGASWNFVIWGIFHGTFLAGERTKVLSWVERLPYRIAQLWTVLIVLIGWVPFRAATLRESVQYLTRMFSFGISDPEVPPLLIDLANNRALFALSLALVSALSLSSIQISTLKCKLESYSSTFPSRVVLAQGLLSLLFLFASTLALVNSHFHPFIYFRF